MPQTENIGDLLLQQLNDPQKMQQLGQMLSSLGLGGPANAQTNAQQASSGQGSSEPNLSALLSALQQQMENGSSGQNQPSQAPAGAESFRPALDFTAADGKREQGQFCFYNRSCCPQSLLPALGPAAGRGAKWYKLCRAGSIRS